ncbi:DUF1376 domain-containing protein [Variovorax sp. H27-G14]|uniref:DUF1376 domain-containing protein n=1 Tax=Variovorax sp. H27-G14 TaxID=3111914 RepID=UPI0038FD0063
MTEPMVPPDCDLRGMPFMPLHCQRLLDSDLFGISTGDEFKAAVALWAKSWNQAPAGSLPKDERVLAHLSSAKSWKKVREMAMRGWVLCSDDRYYHPLIAEYVLEAWGRREDFREVRETKETRQQRWRDKVKQLSGLLRAAGITPPAGASLEKLTSLCVTHVDGFVDAQASTGRRDVDDPEMSLTGDSRQGTGDSKETGDIARANPVLSAGEVCKAIRSAGVADANPSSPKLVKLIEAGITLDEFIAAAEAAVRKQAGFGYALTTAENRRRDATVAPLPAAAPGRPPATEPEWRREQRERVQQAAPYAAARRDPKPTSEVFDALPPTTR